MIEDPHPTTVRRVRRQPGRARPGHPDRARNGAATLAHVDSCPRCAEELEQLSHASDAVVSVAPEIEPPMGFEVRLFNRMGLAEAPVPSAIPPARQQRPARWGERVPRWALAGAAAVIALALGLGIGWSTGSGHGGPTQAQVARPGAEIAAGNLTANGSTVGSVNTYGGSKPWMIVTLADSWTDGKVTCEVVTDDGVTHEVGSFTRDGRVRRLGRTPSGVAPGRTKGRGGVVHRQGDRHRHVDATSS